MNIKQKRKKKRKRKKREKKREKDRQTDRQTTNPDLKKESLNGKGPLNAKCCLIKRKIKTKQKPKITPRNNPVKFKTHRT